MKSPLVPIDILSVYKNKFDDPVPLPARMARCTPDMYLAIVNTSKALAKRGGKLILSDLFRSYEMQFQAHLDYVSGKKSAYSPPPGGSFHEAGRAFDLDLNAMKIGLDEFWELAATFGLVPIINEPKKGASESWHFECRGSHQIVYQYYHDGKGTNFEPYKAAAASSILAIGVHVDAFGDNQVAAAMQSGLIRLGKEIGSIDGQIGHRTQTALEELGINFDLQQLNRMQVDVENLVQRKFPAEFVSPLL